mmetsp:Transcript_591/g.756  ORF Transcript_591/g.756 Transcript_591/m.756 type:complete len:256 (+) Transcript_591:2052-2819(+)
MHGGNLYPIFDLTKSDVFITLSRCVLLFVHMSPGHLENYLGLDLYRQRFDAVHSIEFLVACVTFHIFKMDQYSCAALMNYAKGNYFSPNLIPDPQSFVNNLIEQLTFLVDMNFNDPMGGRNSDGVSSQHFHTKLSLIGCMKSDPEWNQFILKGKEHIKEYMPGERRLPHFLEEIFSLAQDFAPQERGAPNASFLSMPTFNSDLLQLRACNNPGCGKVEKSKGELRQCSGCHSAFYCSRDCQKAHWKRHKKECKSA